MKELESGFFTFFGHTKNVALQAKTLHYQKSPFGPNKCSLAE